MANTAAKKITYDGKPVQVESAIRDGSGKEISSTYLKLSGGTMTGTLVAKGNQYADSYSGSLNMNNSNIYGLNSIYTCDASNDAAEGIHFYRDSTHVDTLYMKTGNLRFAPNRALGTSSPSDDYIVAHAGNVTTGDSNGQVKIAGTNVSVKGLGNAAYAATEATLADDANLPTGAAVKAFVEGKGYTTNTGTVTQVKVGSTAYNPSSGVISLPAYPTVSYPVTSVNSKTGAVSLTASDVSALASNTSFATINGTSVKSSTAFNISTITKGTFTMPAATTRCKLIEITNANYVNNNYTAHLKFRIHTAVSNPYENFTAEVHWSGAVANILVFSGNNTVTTSAPIRYLSAYVTKTLSASGFGCFIMVENGSSTARAMNIEVLEADVPFTLSSGTLAAHGQTDGNFNIDRIEVANNADRVMVTSGRIVTNITGYADGGANWSYYLYNDYWGVAGEYLASGSIIAKGSDGKAYVLKARTDKVFALPLTVARANSAISANANCAVQHQTRNLAVSTLTSMTADSTAVGAPLYIRGSLDANGYFICDGHYSSTMANGYTWVQIGSFARGAVYWNLDASHIQHAITLDNSGKVTHVDGKLIKDMYTHPDSGVISGTYRSVTVTAQGHVIAGTNPTTLSGYGITDALPSNTTFATINGTSVKSGTAFTLQKPITISNSAPSGGSDGDIWIQYS